VPPEDEPDDMDSHRLAFDLEALVVRDGRSRACICAWCDAVCIEDAWYHADLITFAWRVDPRASHSHTICPEGFARAVPGVPYPG
jgi:hypothetical protein